MKTIQFFRPIHHFISAISILLLLIAGSCLHAQEKFTDRAEVPYFEIPGEGDTEVLPLQSTFASVRIAGVIAHVTVKQVYQNRGKKPIEAIYVFPGSTRAAVHAMKMKIGERTIVAKIEEREKARKDYNDALNDGRSASLLEQQRPNVFQMNVGNIMPGDLVEVELEYTEHLLATNGIYEFVYPTVVGPKYSGKGENTVNPDWSSNPYLKEGTLPTYTFNLDCSITSGIPLKDVRCTSHKVNIDYKDRKTVNISLGNSELEGGNRDFILQYRLGGNGLESGVWLYSDGQENYFMATLQPPSAVKPEMIPSREYIFIVDVSGSMYGFPMEITKTLVSELLNGLKSSDHFNILFFAGGADLFAKEPVNASRENIAKATKMLESQSGSGGTELLPALKMALGMNQNNDFARSFVIATDGYVTVEKEAFSLIRSNLNKASFFAFGIGTSVNRYLLEGMAHAGSGEATIITSQKEAKAKAEAFKNYISTPLLTNISLTFNGLDAYEVWPATIPDVFASRPVVIFGKYQGNAKGNIVLTGTNGDGKFSSSIDLSNVNASDENAALKYLWAREQIRQIDDFAGGSETIPEETRKQVTQLGLKYNLLTAYTSFLAIDSEIRNVGGEQTSVKQPLPLPQGVSEYAVRSSAVGYALPFVSRSSDRLNVLTEEETNEQPEAFVIVETMPEFPGGKKALEKYFTDNLNYPEAAKKAGISGKVTINFVVEADGSLSDIKIIKGLGFGCDEEVLRLITQMPKWKPGKQRGKVVSVRMTLPVKF